MTQVAQALIAELGTRHQIDVWTLSDEPVKLNILGAHQVRVFTRPTLSLPAYYLSRSGLPYFLARHESAELHQALRQLTTTSYDLVILHSPFVLQYVGDIPGPVVVHVMDALSDWFCKTARTAPFFKRLHLLAEAGKATKVERGLGRARALTTVSETDSQTLQKLLPQAKIVFIPIGLNTDILYPPTKPRLPSTLVMTGIMDYPPNVDAAEFFVHQVWPAVRAQHPTAQLQIVGKRPTESVRALGSVAGVTVTGEVPSVADFLRSATIAVSPLRFGTGYKIKINEALACGAPVIASPASLPGTGVTAGETCLVADTAEEWKNQVHRLLSDPAERQRLSRTGLSFAQARTWANVAKQYESVYYAASEK